MEPLKSEQKIVWKSDSSRKTDDVSTKDMNRLNRSVSSVHLESYLQTSIGKACCVYVLFFVVLQAQHNRGKGNLAISSILQGISQCWAKRVARWQMGTRTLSLTSCCCSKKAVLLVRDKKSWWWELEEPEDTELMWSPMDWVLVAAMPCAGLYSVLCVCVCVRARSLLVTPAWSGHSLFGCNVSAGMDVSTCSQKLCRCIKQTTTKWTDRLCGERMDSPTENYIPITRQMYRL